MRRRAVLIALALAAAAPLGAQERPTGPLARELGPLLQHPRWHHATWGALVVSLTYGDTLFAWRADRRFIPASNAKLFTTAAALHYLGPAYRFLTVLYADGPIRTGELAGDLVLYGTGDPTFARDTASLAPFADSVVRAGIRRIRGDVVGDASFLGAELTGPGWSPDNAEEGYAAPPSALGAAENRLWLTVLPGPRTGAATTHRVEPTTDLYRIVNRVTTGRTRGRTRIAMRRLDATTIELTGTINPRSRGWGTWVVVHEPPVFAASMLRQLLLARGVVVDGFTRAVVDDVPGPADELLRRLTTLTGPEQTTLAVHRSPPLTSIVTMINHRSHNLSAEIALRSIGRVRGAAGTFAEGARLVERYLTGDVGIPAEAVQVTDGSGLSLLDAATPGSLVQLLAFMRRAPEGEDFYSSLPLVGEGMRRRMTSTAATGRLRAKTGTLNGVSALSGYVMTEMGEELAFSLLVNVAPSIRRARLVQDSIGVRLAQVTRRSEVPRP
jgi:D-alanyl-D-alanine carboxypeptidase/D-alanyl-D-alanine-endopeptidase (penicillin-binding protein 4)